jgi:hypothetical protein
LVDSGTSQDVVEQQGASESPERLAIIIIVAGRILTDDNDGCVGWSEWCADRA